MSEPSSLSTPPTLVEQLIADYARFPREQSFQLYADTVQFRDPMTQFRGIRRYQEMIQFMGTWFQNIQMELHDIQRDREMIHTRWTLHFTAPVPWQPRISIPGVSHLTVATVDHAEKIVLHVDEWDISRWQVLRQLFQS